MYLKCFSILAIFATTVHCHGDWGSDSGSGWGSDSGWGSSRRPRPTSTTTQPPAPLTCGGTVRANTPQYFFGYGSSMLESGKAGIYGNLVGPNIPVEVTGYRRDWNLRADVETRGEYLGPSMMFVGAVSDPQSKISGAMFHLNGPTNVTAAINQIDAGRYFYCRQPINTKNLRILGASETVNLQSSQFWIYVNRNEYIDRPSRDYPIVQSYVDVLVSGCLELEGKFNLTGFAKSCVDTTKGWSGQYWVNDRIFPRRPSIHQPLAEEIDTILKASVPTEFRSIRIE